jgi:NAD(P)-dependent dehydrogenase (short-subunit alcohol dehydrogenase family)
MSTTPKTILITGATAGIGRMTALHLAKEGHHVIATGRKAAELSRLATDAEGLRLDTLRLDVTSPSSIADAVIAVDRMTGGKGPDVLVNNAGFGILGPSSEIPDAELRRQYETNVFGLMNVTRAFIPKMRERRAGRIINVSSVGGRLVLPYFGVYNSTKYAVEALSDALRYELRPFGIDVALIEPGVIRTNFEATAVADLAAYRQTPYKNALDRYEQMSKLADRFASNPIVIARAISRAVRARRPAARYVAPRSTNFAIWFRALAPTFLWDWAMRKIGHLDAKTLEVAPVAAPEPVAPVADAISKQASPEAVASAS